MNFYSMNQLLQKVAYSRHTIYKKIKLMTEGVHYTKPNGGKIFFSDQAVDFLTKGDHNENIKRNCVQKERQSISMAQFLNQQKEKIISN